MEGSGQPLRYPVHTCLRTAACITIALAGCPGQAAQAQYTYTELHTFTSPDGLNPFGNLLRDASGNLYGTTNAGGTNSNGTIWKYSNTGSFGVLYNFDATSGSSSRSAVTTDSAGNLYAATAAGAASGVGAFVKLNSDGSLNQVYALDSAVASYPGGAPAVDAAGNMFGAAWTNDGGSNGNVFKITPGGAQSIEVDFNAVNAVGGMSLVIHNGVLYGTSAYGGIGNGNVFKVDDTGYHDIYDFTDGGQPTSPISFDAAGNLYGTTLAGGPSGSGQLFEITAGGTFKKLWDFTGTTDGYEPYNGVVADASGNLFGTTISGGDNPSPDGVVYEYSNNGVFSVLHTFHNIPGESTELYGGVVLDGSGNLFGTLTYTNGPTAGGALFELSYTAPIGTPEPGSTALALVTGCFAVGGVIRRKRAKK